MFLVLELVCYLYLIRNSNNEIELITSYKLPKPLTTIPILVAQEVCYLVIFLGRPELYSFRKSMDYGCGFASHFST